MINTTENEALEALMSEEEKYPAGIQPLPLFKPACLAALLNDEGSKVKAQIWHIQQRSQCLPNCSWSSEHNDTMTKLRQTAYY